MIEQLKLLQIGEYSKKKVTIKALQWNGNNVDDIRNFVGDQAVFVIESNPGDTKVTNLYIQTLEGTMKASVTDMIIQGINKEYYPCKLDIFNKTYESVNYTENNDMLKIPDYVYDWLTEQAKKSIKNIQLPFCRIKFDYTYTGDDKSSIKESSKENI